MSKPQPSHQSSPLQQLDPCPLRTALNIIGGKWKIQILWVLAHSPVFRYSQLKREVPGITDMMLSQSLKELERDNVVLRTQYNEIPPRVEYRLSENGRCLLPAMEALSRWGSQQPCPESGQGHQR